MTDASNETRVRWGPDDVEFVVLTHKGDVHYARALLASIRHFYPDHRVLILTDGDLIDPKLERWETCTVLRTRDLAASVGLPLHGVLSKLALLYRHDHPFYCYFDADSIMVSPLFSDPGLQVPADFYAVDGRTIDLHDPENLRTFTRFALDPARVRATIDPNFTMRHVTYMSGGHFVLRRGAIPTDLLESHLDELSATYEAHKVFHFNDQSWLNWVVNRLAADGQLELVGLPLGINGKRSVADHPEVTVEAIRRQTLLPRSFIHYTGPSRHLRLRDHNFPEVLNHFHGEYYRDLPAGSRVRDEAQRLLSYQGRRVRGRVRRVLQQRRASSSDG